MYSERKSEFICVDPAIYTSSSPGFEESRTLALAKYVEGELTSERKNEMDQHLKECEACTAFLKRFDAAEIPSDEMLEYAVCPSSKTLDAYLFDPGGLPSKLKTEIDLHLAKCPLCEKESRWMKDSESNQTYQFQASTVRKVNYLTIAAAIFFLGLSGFLFWQKQQSGYPDKQLQALAVIEEPNQIDYSKLTQASPALSPALQARFENGVTLF